MREGWEIVRLGDVLTQVHRPVVVAELDEVPFAGVRWYGEGVYHRDTVDPANVKTRSLNRLHAGDVTYNRMWATKSSFGVVGREADQCLVTNDFPIFEADARRTSSDYIGLLFHWHPFQEQAASAATGTTERRRLNEKQFVQISVPLPPLQEQRRIVDLIGALDDTIAAAENQHAALSKSLDVTRSALLVPLDGWAATTLGQVATRQIGRTPPRKEPRYWTADPSQRPFCTIAAMSDPAVSSCSEGVTELAERDGVAKRVPAGSLLMSFKLSIGRLAVPAQDVFPNEAIAWIRPKEGVLQEFLRHALTAVKWDELGSRAVMGKTLNAASLDAVPLAVPPQAEQARIVETLGAIERGAEASKLQVDRLRALRSNLLTALLSGEHAIPESYDELMKESAA